MASSATDWSAVQYLKFDRERTRAVHDLVGQLARHFGPSPPARIVDLGCGPGNSTAVLAATFPAAVLSGLDASPAMLERARALRLPGVDFALGDVAAFAPPPDADLLFSNAVLHWLRRPARLPTVARLVAALKPAAVLALQVPDNWAEPSHRAMREVAYAPGTPWSPYFADMVGAGAGAAEARLHREDRPDLDPVESPAAWYNALIGHCSVVDVWHTSYEHVLPGPADIVEWVKGSGLQPFVNALPEEGDVREAFLQAYEERVAELYPRLADGKVMLRYPRLFVVAVRK